MHPNYADTRRMTEDFALNWYAQNHPEIPRDVIEPILREWSAANLTDEVLAAQFRQMRLRSARRKLSTPTITRLRFLPTICRRSRVRLKFSTRRGTGKPSFS